MELNKTSGGSSIIPDRVLSAGNTTWVGSPVSNPSVSDGSPTPLNRVLNAGETTCPSVPDGSPTPPNRVLNAGSPIRVLDAGKTTCPLVPGPRKKRTTILWWRISDSELMMIIDSRCSSVNTVDGKVIKTLDSDNNIKYRQFNNGVIAMCGEAHRCVGMIDALTAQDSTLDVHYLRDAGVEYLRMNPLPPFSGLEATFTICGWVPSEEKYELYAIGDQFMKRTRNPGCRLIDKPLYGCGSGSRVALDNLEVLISKSPDGKIDKDSLVKAVIDTCFKDYHTGGYLQVFHFKNGGEILHESIDLVDILCNTEDTKYKDYKERVFSDRNLLIFLKNEDQEIMGHAELYDLAARTFPGLTLKKDIVTSLWVSDYLTTYLVEMETPNRKKTLIRKLQELGGVTNQALPRSFAYRNLRKKSCYYFMAQAEKFTLVHAKNATSLEHLRELVTRRPQV